jgi:methionyl-tRNA formyltransferase
MVFMGTPDFAAKSLEHLAEGFDISLVITQPDRPHGRGKKLKASPVKTVAEAKGIPVMTPEKIAGDDAVYQRLLELAPDVIVVVAYGQMLPKRILELPKFGCINLHASLLPAWRGAAPIQQAIIAGDQVSGNTTMLMDEGLDTGDILLKDEVKIPQDMTYGELHDRLMEGGGPLLEQTVNGLIKGSVKPEAQPEEGVSHVRKFTKQDAEIDFSKSTVEVLNLVRGMAPRPLAYTWADDMIVKIVKASGEDWTGQEAPGTILAQEKTGILVKTGDGALAIHKLQLPGKRPLAVGDFLNGNRFQQSHFKRSV